MRPPIAPRPTYPRFAMGTAKSIQGKEQRAKGKKKRAESLLPSAPCPLPRALCPSRLSLRGGLRGRSRLRRRLNLALVLRDELIEVLSLRVQLPRGVGA